MTPRVVAVAGPLDADRLAEVGALYGRADAKYLRADVREHLFVTGPAGPALHALAHDGDALVGHAAIVPIPARIDGRPLASGKVEALFVDEAHRGRRGDARPLAFDLLDALYELGDRSGVELLHAFVRPEVGRVLRFDPVPAGPPTFVAVTGSLPAGAPGGRAAAGGLRALHAAASVAARRDAALRELTAEDVDLVTAPTPPAGAWTVLAEDVWRWCVASPLLRVLESDGSRLLLQLPGSAGDALRLVGRGSTRSAVRDVSTCVRLARALGAPTLRFQPWSATGPELQRACRVLGLVRRSDFTTLCVRDAARKPPLAPSPLLYVGY